MTRFDLKRELGHLYSATGDATVVNVPQMNFFAIEGRGDPNTAKEYADAVQTLFPLSYGVKFIVKREIGIDYGIMPLEGLWWVPGGVGLNMDNKENWEWEVMIMQPKFASQGMLLKALDMAKEKELPSISKVKIEVFEEGLAVQILHTGPYSAERPTIEKLHRFISESGYAIRGKHHEIYLSDKNRTLPEKLKTIVRQPVSK